MKDEFQRYVRELCDTAIRGWDRFWFQPLDPSTLGLIRICAGTMLFYTHLVWGRQLQGFLGEQGRIPPHVARIISGSQYAWSHFYWLHSATALIFVHIIALLAFAALTVGWMTRYVSWVAFFFTVSYANRASGVLFGLDQVNGFLALYLAIGPSGDAYSIDQWQQGRAVGPATIGANIAIRLIQCHMCVVYLFAGLGKLLGQSWWAGTALWGAFANFEYQTLDMTWVARFPLEVNFVTQFILAWEIAYIALVWPRLTRPLMLALAVPLHLGIAVCMGMITFGLIMIVGNAAFLPPEFVRRVIAVRRPATT